MIIENKYARRDALSDAELERLLAVLNAEAERYRYAIRNYPPDGPDRRFEPFLLLLEERIEVVQRLIQERSNF